jgi:prepilin-type N-terminal cleavage/methylation domain-containing protein
LLRTVFVSCRRGFTLIELLVVVAIISILAGIAVPNFLEAQTRSKVSRIMNDQRTLATALESYFVDENRYPPRQKYREGDLLGAGDITTRAEDLSRLTTPIQYLSSLPIDIFEVKVQAPNNLIDYYPPVMVAIMSRESPPGWSGDYEEEAKTSKNWEYGWALMSVGPDRIFGAASNMGRYPEPYATTNSYWNSYDPTNGTISLGNIYRFQKNGAIAENAFAAP